MNIEHLCEGGNVQFSMLNAQRSIRTVDLSDIGDVNNITFVLRLASKKQKMAYNQKLAGRIRDELAKLTGFEEKEMMGGLAFMVNDKMCVGVIKDELMCRIDPAMQEEVLKRPGCRRMEFTGRPLKGFVLVDETGTRTKKELVYWIQLCLDFNPKAKSSKKRK